jgi:hypothetical protein
MNVVAAAHTFTNWIQCCEFLGQAARSFSDSREWSALDATDKKAVDRIGAEFSEYMGSGCFFTERMP